MPIPEFIKALTEQRFSEYCDKKIPAHVKHQINLSFKFRGNSVTLIENRVPWRKDITDWTSMPVAQLRYNEKINQWKLYCADRNSKWHWYNKFESGLDECLAEIDRDPTGIFWG